MIRKILAAALSALLFAAPAFAQSPGFVPSGQVIGNAGATRALGAPVMVTSVIDRAISTTQGAVLTRNASAWVGLAPGTSGLPLLSAGAGANLAYGIPALAAGGTGANLTASNGGIFYSTATTAAILSGTATAGQILRSGASTAPAWSTATYPATTSANQILYSSANNVISNLATANRGVLATGATGVPSITQNPVLGLAGTQGSLSIAGTTSGTVTVAVQAAAGTYNFNLPTAAGTSGDPLLSGGGGATAMTFGKLALTGLATQADNTVLGNVSGGAAAPIALTATQLTTLCNPFTDTIKGCVNFPTTATGKVLRDDNTWVAAAGGGTVTSVDALGGVAVVAGSAITTSGVLHGTRLVNAQTGTTYTVLDTDRGKLVTHTNGSAIASTLPQAGAGSAFLSGWFSHVQNRGAGTVTITPTTSTIDGAATLVLATGQGALIASDGTNYFTERGRGLTSLICGTGLTGGTITTSGTCAVDYATAGEFFNATASKALQPSVVYTAEITTTYGTTTTFDFNNFIHSSVTLTGNITTMSVSNARAGKAGVIRFIQDGTGSRTTVWNSIFKFSGGAPPTLTTTASMIDVLSYFCSTATYCAASLAKDVK